MVRPIEDVMVNALSEILEQMKIHNQILYDMAYLSDVERREKRRHAEHAISRNSAIYNNEQGHSPERSDI